MDDTGTVTISPSGPITKTPGDIFSLVCSADNFPEPFYRTPPLFVWLFGPDNSSLPSGVVVTNNSSNTNYTSTLHFSPLNENHTGIYTCRIGYSAASIIIFVGGKEPAIRNDWFTVIFCSLHYRSCCPHQQCWYSDCRWKLQSHVHCDWNKE